MELQWPLIVFTTFICLSAGTFGSVAITSFREEYARIQLPGLATAFVALAIGGGASVLHLETPSRYFGQLGNIRSGINQEIIMMALVGFMMVVYFIQLRRTGKAGKTIKIVSAVLSLLLVLTMGHLYMMPARPAWNTVLLPTYYLFNAILLGVLVTVLLAAATGKPDPKLGTTAVAILGAFTLNIAVYVFYIISLSKWVYSDVLHVDTTTVPSVDPAVIGERLLSGDLAFLFWGAVIVIGLVLPLVILLVVRKATGANVAVFTRNIAAVAIVLVVAGGLAFRVLLYFAASTVFVY
jgi:anaerobic dimethyl sulfoxide reductase subunit C (anchor subunit)